MKESKSTSRVSQAIVSTMNYLSNKNLALVSRSQSYTIKIANTLEEREAVFRLGYQVYLEKGYTIENSSEMLIRDYDFESETTLLIVLDQQKKIVGSVSMLFDDNFKLPVEKIFCEEVAEIKNECAKIAELSRLVICPNNRNAKEILLLLFNYLAIYIFQAKNCDHMVVQVNPRHKEYYKALLSFDEIGGQKLCPQVQNAPSALLHLSKEKKQTIMNQVLAGNLKTRSLYPYFLKPEQEALVAYSLERQAKPMTAEEKIYFGYATTGISEPVCV